MTMAKKRTYQVGGNRAVITWPPDGATHVGMGVMGQGDRRPRNIEIWGQLLHGADAPILPNSKTLNSDGTFSMTFGPLTANNVYKFQVSFDQNLNTIEDEIDFTA
jgi:hypothetical protein